MLVATLVPATKAGMQPKINAFNAQLPGVVKQRRDKGRHVRLIDMSAVTAADLANPAHPNDNGYRKMADAFLDGIIQAAEDGWITKTVNGSGKRCTGDGGPRDGWQSLGVVATGVRGPGGNVMWADYNGDGRDDYLLVADDGSVRAWANQGDKKWAALNWDGQGRIATGVGASGGSVRFADINGDRRADYLVVGANGSARARLNATGSRPGTADGKSWADIGEIFPGRGGQAAFADIDSDGRAEYVRIDDNGAVSAWLNKAREDITNRKPFWVPLSDLFPSGKASGGQVRMPDISGDGRADYVAMGENGSARAWVNIPPRADAPPKSAPKPTWRERGQFNPWVGTNGNQIRFAEINGDRRADYLQIHENGTVQAFVNTPDSPASLIGSTGASSCPADSPARSASPTSTATAATTTCESDPRAPSTPSSTPRGRTASPAGSNIATGPTASPKVPANGSGSPT
ncbi:FG-GAP-like repeat-containing protein [Nonomuraea lactucae]|uniref:FG-GAP-like repeat-containing protein n=1 Tax=Nonomuraea lactucae TaxID=2249762 RepID=UPI000DE30B93|nr:FG-GAP-like repeat-containing protein [Nonomuraea lactucae]